MAQEADDMKCLRCGYCCMTSFVVVVDDPDRGPTADNLKAIGQNGYERCHHLQGTEPGEFSCAVHDKPWYPETPCFSHGQIERSPDDECRTGRYILDNPEMLGRMVEQVDTRDLKSRASGRASSTLAAATTEDES